MLLENISDLMDYPNYYDKTALIADFNHKYLGTTVLLDGTPQVLKEINNKEIITDKKIYPYTENITINNIILKPGLYSTNEDLVYVYRMPEKQWYKSYFLGINLNIINLINKTPLTSPIYKYRFHGKTCEHKKKVFLFWKEVGTIKGFYLVLNKQGQAFLKELQELWPQYQVISDILYLKKSMDGSLNIQF